jgi:hypothetical protein
MPILEYRCSRREKTAEILVLAGACGFGPN